MRNEKEIIDEMSQCELLEITKEIPIEILNEVSQQFSKKDFDFNKIIKPIDIRSALVLCERRGIK